MLIISYPLSVYAICKMHFKPDFQLAESLFYFFIQNFALFVLSVITNFDLSYFLSNKKILTSMGIVSLKMIQTYVIAFEKNGIEEILFYLYHFKNCFRLWSIFTRNFSEVPCQYEFQLKYKTELKYFTKESITYSMCIYQYNFSCYL